MKNQQSAASTNQIKTSRPSLPKSSVPLTGNIANSFNGGHYKTIACYPIMAGQKNYEDGIVAKIKLLTPKTPAYQRLNCTMMAVFCPDTRVWKNALKYHSQKGGTSELKITEKPNMGTIPIPIAYTGSEYTQGTPFFNTEAFRDSITSSYIPRFTAGGVDNVEELSGGYMPPMDVLRLRDIRAIWNDLLRNKEYETEQLEFDGDTCTEREFYSYIADDTEKQVNLSYRAKRPDSYYTDYRTELQGFETNFPPSDMSSDVAVLNWLSKFEQYAAETRAQANNAQKTDWEILSELFGSKKLTEGKVQIIGKKTFALNYQAITQNAYNNNEDIAEEFRVLGQQGAYSYTEVKVPLVQGIEFVEPGRVHVIAWVWAESVFEKAIDRRWLNIHALDEYRPDMVAQKEDVIYECEYGAMKKGPQYNPEYYKQVRGFKRRFNEYFKLPNTIAGDITTDNFYKESAEGYAGGGETITQKTYTFYERDAENYQLPNGQIVRKEHYKDYTDLLINKNQAIMNTVLEKYDDIEDKYELLLQGPNQIDIVGQIYSICELPIAEEIKDDFLRYGEH